MLKKATNKIKTNVEPDDSNKEKFILQLFVAGALPNSARAVKNIHIICEKYLKGRYELEIIDVYQQPTLALTENIIALPVLIKKFPLPEERLIGDLSNFEKVNKGLNLVYPIQLKD